MYATERLNYVLYAYFLLAENLARFHGHKPLLRPALVSADQRDPIPCSGLVTCHLTTLIPFATCCYRISRLKGHEKVSDLTIYSEVEPGSIVPGIWSPIREDDPALVPSLVALADVGEIDAALAVRPAVGVFQ